MIPREHWRCDIVKVRMAIGFIAYLVNELAARPAEAQCSIKGT